MLHAAHYMPLNQGSKSSMSLGIFGSS